MIPQRIFLMGRTWESAQADPRGSPFQTPTRLADGLGHGSDLGSHGLSRITVRPILERSSRNLGPPRWSSGRKANLGCITAKRLISQNHRLSSDLGKCFSTRKSERAAATAKGNTRQTHERTESWKRNELAPN